MNEKEGLKSQDQEVNSISKILEEPIYSINIQGHDRTDYSKESMDIAIWADKWSQNILYKLFLILQSELDLILKIMSNNDKFSFICDILVDDFYTDLKKKIAVENILEKKIKDLQEFKFNTSKDLYKIYEDLEDEYEEVSLDEVIEMIQSLRKRNIDIYKEILLEVKRNKEKYIDAIIKEIE